MGRTLAALAALAVLLCGCGSPTPTTQTQSKTGAATSSEATPRVDVAAEARQFVADKVGAPNGDFSNSDTSWARSITGFPFEQGFSHGKLRVTMQVDRGSPDGVADGARAARDIAHFIRRDGTPTLRANITVVETVDGMGTLILEAGV